MKTFLITDPEYYGSDPRRFALRFARILRKTRPDAVIFRDKQSKHFDALAKAFVATARRFGIKQIFINHRLKTAAKFAAGIHLTSTQHRLIRKAKQLGLTVLVSTHSRDELRTCRRLGADYLLFSPIFRVKDKGEPKGLEELNQIVDTIRANIIALGGITTDEEVRLIATAKPYGFASIRYFTKGN